MVRIADEHGHEWPAVIIEAHSVRCVSVNAFTYGGVKVLTSLVLYEEGRSPTRVRTWWWPATNAERGTRNAESQQEEKTA